jgi:hypothetical protein
MKLRNQSVTFLVIRQAKLNERIIPSRMARGGKIADHELDHVLDAVDPGVLPHST